MIEIDVIIANYNNAKFLVKCLDSVLSQALLAKEIIVIDDASTDDSLLILEEYSSAGKITLIKNERTLGVAASRKIAISYGGSEFLTTLDADDYYYNNEKLAAEAAVISAAGGSGIAFSDVMRVDHDGNEMWLVSSKRKLREGNLSFYIANLNGYIPRDYLVSRTDYEAVDGYDASFKIYEDWDLKIRLAKRCEWHYSGNVGTAYRNNPKGLSRSPRREHVIAMRRIFWKNYSSKNPLFRAGAFIRFFFYHSLYQGRPAI